MRLFQLLPALAAVAVSVSACAGSGDGDEAAGAADLSVGSGQTPKFDINHLLDDEDVLGGGSITVDQVQSFLESKRSALATYEEGGASAAQIIIDRCQADGVNPVYMLARIQGESSLVASGTSKNLEHATGCACPDGHACASEKAGFANQITCAADLIRSYFDALDAKGKTPSGYAVGQSLRTFDPCNVTPNNRATVAIYTYTPWVGPYGAGCGSSKSLGGTGLAEIYKEFKGAFPAPSAPEAQVDDDQ
jgi:hypothetical protein